MLQTPRSRHRTNVTTSAFIVYHDHSCPCAGAACCFLLFVSSAQWSDPSVSRTPTRSDCLPRGASQKPATNLAFEAVPFGPNFEMTIPGGRFNLTPLQAPSTGPLAPGSRSQTLRNGWRRNCPPRVGMSMWPSGMPSTWGSTPCSARIRRSLGAPSSGPNSWSRLDRPG